MTYKMLTNPVELRNARLYMWVNKITSNLEEIKDEMRETPDDRQKYIKLRRKLIRQYQLLRFMYMVLQGKAKIEGWKVED